MTKKFIFLSLFFGIVIGSVITLTAPRIFGFGVSENPDGYKKSITVPIQGDVQVNSNNQTQTVSPTPNDTITQTPSPTSKPTKAPCQN